MSRGNPSSGRQVSDLTPPSMSTPRPSEADVEAREALWSKPCPFCPIVEGDAPANIIERGDRHVAFVPLGPHAPGHVLFVPTEHLPDATVNPERTGAIVAEAARYVAENRIDANIVTSVGVAATQSVPHLHVHVVPRGPADGLDARWPWLATPDADDASDPTAGERGLEARFYVRKMNDPSGKHAECRYFVLDPQHDPIARQALVEYARRTPNKALRRDLWNWLESSPATSDADDAAGGAS